jgi:hypothetical protein
MKYTFHIVDVFSSTMMMGIGQELLKRSPDQ